ncbi:unnamed protein product [Cyprideis torosa]|uniref:Eukaryotic translation initiation factor 3 subunit B n=1 Tax=Cyprideis torosa TaxID=163714 RepID=A0A7R8ZMG8_9CRUS|nr:unnamed protein product [Cyprideis torosa]CAG0895495.1 unnamed protein product [Cyprideis torosa]
MVKKREGEQGENPRSEAENGEEQEEEPDFSDPEDFLGDTDEELLADILAQRPQENDSVESVIIVDGIPVVGPDRLPKLKTVLTKLFERVARIEKDFYPLTEEGGSKGYCFFEYENLEAATATAAATNNHRLDKNHVLQVNLYSEYEKFMSIPQDWTPPEPAPYKDVGNLKHWLLDPDCYDQYAVIAENFKTSIYTNSFPEPTLVEERVGWTESNIVWSPLGTYMATFHGPGVALWGGPKFSQITKFSHQDVQWIDFSPQETYIVTFSPYSVFRGGGGDSSGATIIVWEVRTGQKKRTFQGGRISDWPAIKWSHDDKYFAKLGQDMLSVYETPSCGLHEKKSIKVNGIRDFSWSPSENLIAYWVAEDQNIPAKVSLLAIPSREEVRTANLFNVADCRIHWQKTGDYVCVKVDRYTKFKKDKDEIKYSGIFYNFEVFHMREKEIPVDSVEIKETIQWFAWEPVGSKFAVVHGEAPHISVSFYSIHKSGQTPTLDKKFDNKLCNKVFWSPNGQYCVLAGMQDDKMKGVFEFVDTADYSILNAAEHFQATDVEWDPTGRYVVTSVSWWMYKVDNGFTLWNFQGKKLQTHARDKFSHFTWRPRPPTLLTPQMIKKVKRNLKSMAAEFEIKDRMKMSRESKELLEKRRRLMDEFNALREKRLTEWEEEREARLELRGGIDTDAMDEDEELEEETIEFLVKEEVTVVEE